MAKKTKSNSLGLSVARLRRAKLDNQDSVGRPKVGHHIYPDVNLTKLAEACGASFSYMSRIMRGERQPGLTLLRKMAGVLGQTLDEVNANLKLAAAKRQAMERLGKSSTK